MSPDAVVVLFIFFGVFMLAAGGLGYLAGASGRPAPREDVEEAPKPSGPVLDAEVVEEPEDAGEPWTLDPANPPTWKVLRRDRPDLLCACHGKGLEQAERVLWWPFPDGTVRFLHEDAAEAMGLPFPGGEE